MSSARDPGPLRSSVCAAWWGFQMGQGLVGQSLSLGALHSETLPKIRLDLCAIFVQGFAFSPGSLSLKFRLSPVVPPTSPSPAYPCPPPPLVPPTRPNPAHVS